MELPNPIAVMADYMFIVEAAKKIEKANKDLPVEERQKRALNTFRELRDEPVFRHSNPKMKITTLNMCSPGLGEENAKEEFVNLFFDSMKDAEKISEKAKVLMAFGKRANWQHVKLAQNKIKNRRKI